MKRILGAMTMAVMLLAAATAEADRPAASGRKSPAAKSATAKSAAGKALTAKSPAVADSRRLSDIHIEGEIPVPQVLFVSVGDQRRFIDFQHRRYLRSAGELGASGLPSRIMTGPPPLPGAASVTSPATGPKDQP
jgi:hypothetical protein